MRQDELRTGGLGWVLLGLFLAALTLRPQLLAIGPLYPRIETTFELSSAAGGWLSAIPVLGLGIFAPMASTLAARFGPRRATTVCVVALGVFGLARAGASGTATMLLATVGVAIGMGAAGALLPVAVKAMAPGRPAFATGIYAAGIQLGAASTAWSVVPMADRVGWRGSLAVVSVLTLLCAVVLAAIGRGGRGTGSTRRPMPLRDPLAWRLAAVFGLQAMPYFALNAWLPTYLVDGGWTQGDAGFALAVMNLSALAASLTMPRLMDRYARRRVFLVVPAIAVASSVPVVLTRPTLAWPALVVLGVAVGVLFAAGLVLPLDVAPDPGAVAATSGMVLGVGYIGAASAPVLLGALRDLVSGNTAPVLVVAVAMVALVLVAAPLDPGRLARGIDLATQRS